MPERERLLKSSIESQSANKGKKQAVTKWNF